MNAGDFEYLSAAQAGWDDVGYAVERMAGCGVSAEDRQALVDQAFSEAPGVASLLGVLGARLVESLTAVQADVEHFGRMSHTYEHGAQCELVRADALKWERVERSVWALLSAMAQVVGRGACKLDEDKWPYAGRLMAAVIDSWGATSGGKGKES